MLLFCTRKMSLNFDVSVANERHIHLAETICAEMEASAKVRGTGIAKRDPEYIRTKMREGKAVIAFAGDGSWAGFCYIEAWSHGQFVANSGLIVAPSYRKSGLARQIKAAIFDLTRTRYPDAKIFGLTTGLAVMKINSDLGYEPVTYSELTQDEEFWKGCRSCVNYDILMSKERKNCLCTAMLYDPAEKEHPPSPPDTPPAALPPVFLSVTEESPAPAATEPDISKDKKKKKKQKDKEAEKKGVKSLDSVAQKAIKKAVKKAAKKLVTQQIKSEDAVLVAREGRDSAWLNIQERYLRLKQYVFMKLLKPWTDNEQTPPREQ